MEQILNNLSEIEATANAIMQELRDRNKLSQKKPKNRSKISMPPWKQRPVPKSRKSVKIWPARKTPGSPSFVQRQKTSYPGWMPTTKPTTRLFPKSCFRK